MRTFWEHVLQDASFGWRGLFKRPGLTATAVLSIALGIGAATAIFSVVYAVLINPYPYRAADRIGWVGAQTGPDQTFQPLFTQAQYLEVLSRVHAIEGAVAVQLRQPVLSGKGLLPEIVTVEKGSPNFFSFLGVPALHGREFSGRDFAPGRADLLAVLSYKFWQREFQGSADAIGKKIMLDRTEYTIIGVLPARFTWADADLYTPISIGSAKDDFVQIYCRLRPKVTVPQARAEFEPLLRTFQKQVPAWFYPPERFRTEWVTLNRGVLGRFSTTLLALLGAVLLLLLIGCGNVANMLLARAISRRGEMAIRISMGATRSRLIRQMLTESLLLAGVSGLTGVLLAKGGIKVVLALLPEYSIPREAVIALSLPVLWFALALTFLTGIVFGLLPAFEVSGKTQAEALQEAGRGRSANSRQRRLYDALIVFELTLSLVLLTGAGMALKGFIAVSRKPLGYDPTHVLTFELPLGDGNYPLYGARRNFFEDVVSRIRALPGVESAAISEEGTPPWNGAQTRLRLDDHPWSEAVLGRFNIVGDGYFTTVRQPLLKGRLFTHDDVIRARPVAIVTRDFAVRFFKNRSPIGQHVETDLLNQRLPAVILKAPHLSNSFEIVGVVGTARNNGLDGPAEPAIFVPYSVICSPGIWMLARTRFQLSAVANDARRVVRDIDPRQAITEVHSLEYWLQFATAYPRFTTFLFGIFGIVGLLLAGAGVFSVVSYGVTQRTREFGIRMALGADRGDILRLIFTGARRVLAIGLLTGVCFSLFAARVLVGRMQGMANADISIFLIAPAVLIAAALIACLLPARTASQVQPIVALRHE